MLRAIFKLLNKPGTARGKPSGERCTPELSSIPGSIVTDGFPRPQWKIIRTWIEGNVTPGNRALACTLIHEVTHNRLAHLPLPLWLNEGIAITMAKRIGRMVKKQFGRKEYQRHSSHWTQETIAGFWNGSSFKAPENDLSQLCYSLAEILTGLLMQEFPGFKDFVLHADKKDAGEGAAREYLGVSLGDAAATFLGPVKWI